MSSESDPNYAAYRSYAGNAEWVREHKGQYAVFVDGKLIGTSVDRQALVAEIRRQYPSKPRFVTPIAQHEDEIDIATAIEWE